MDINTIEVIERGMKCLSLSKEKIQFNGNPKSVI